MYSCEVTLTEYKESYQHTTNIACSDMVI